MKGRPHLLNKKKVIFNKGGFLALFKIKNDWWGVADPRKVNPFQAIGITKKPKTMYKGFKNIISRR